MRTYTCICSWRYRCRRQRLRCAPPPWRRRDLVANVLSFWRFILLWPVTWASCVLTGCFVSWLEASCCCMFKKILEWKRKGRFINHLSVSPPLSFLCLFSMAAILLQACTPLVPYVEEYPGNLTTSISFECFWIRCASKFWSVYIFMFVIKFLQLAENCIDLNNCPIHWGIPLIVECWGVRISHTRFRNILDLVVIFGHCGVHE